MKYLFLMFLILCTSGCGYRLSEKGEGKVALSVPYIKGDTDGLFTSIFARKLSQSGTFEYISKDGEFEVEIAIIGDETNTIGFRYDREETTGVRKKRLETTENKSTVTAQVKLVNAQTKEVLVGPFKMHASADFDFVDQDSAVDISFINPSGMTDSILDFSMGQLDSEEGAKETARLPLYEKLSQKIINALVNSTFIREI